jgi:CheY-like chemotaxis protein/anti-sigma regulatory factor (Ser/Thr protein kinase)
MLILVAEDDEAVLQYVTRFVTIEGHRVIECFDGQQAWEKFVSFHPDLVLTDLNMPGKNGLDLLAQIRHSGSLCPVVIMTGHGTEEAAVQAIRLGANDYLNKPVRANEIRHVLRKCLGQVSSLRSERELILSLVHHSIRLSLPNILQLVPSASNYLVTQCTGLIHADDMPGLRLGLHELLINAIEHGNLGISYEEKSLALQDGVDSLRALYEQRLQDPRIRARRVTVDFLFNGAVLQWIISDEGNGFDFQKTRDPFDEVNIEAQHGRGIYLSRLQFDDFRYEGNGNTVKVSKMVTFPGEKLQNSKASPPSDEIARFT